MIRDHRCMIVIGITGGVASGKRPWPSFCRVWVRRCLDADREGHAVLELRRSARRRCSNVGGMRSCDSRPGRLIELRSPDACLRRRRMAARVGFLGAGDASPN